jgi:gliding motility-associated lipoprotein GldD
MNLKYFFILLIVGTINASCGDENYIPKPRTYPRVDFPQRNYQAFEENYCSFTFERPIYTNIEQTTEFFDQTSKNPCWFDVVFGDLNGRIHCSYASIDGGENTLLNLVEDSQNLVYKHTSKANGIQEAPFSYPENKVYGSVFELKGSVASPYQFYVTDSVNHYLRGSLYFKSAPNPDSMQPVINFVKEDLMHMIKTIKWK